MGEHFAPPFWFVGAQETFDPTTIAVDTVYLIDAFCRFAVA